MLNMFSKMMKENEELRNLMAEQNEKIVDDGEFKTINDNK